MVKVVALIMGFALASQAVASSRPVSAPPPSAIADINACRKIEQPSERLACFDEKVAALSAAIAKNDIYVADKKQVNVARRSLFGLQIHDLWPFHDGDDKDEIKQVDLVVASATQDVDGNWRCRMTDGTSWSQTDEIALGRSPRAGSKAVIRRAALGSFKMSLDGQAGVRARRVF